MTRLNRILQGTLVVWFVAVVFWFFFSLWGTRLIPANCPLPWSSIDDFTVGESGRIYLYEATMARLLCYEQSGEFCGSFQLLSGRGLLKLVSTTSGLLIASKQGVVCFASEKALEVWNCLYFQPDEGQCAAIVADFKIEKMAQNLSSWSREKTIGLKSGEPFFCQSRDEFKGWWIFRRAVVRHQGAGLRVEFSRYPGVLKVARENGGKLSSLRTPWYFEWARYPFPAFVPFLLLALWDTLRQRWRKRRLQRGVGGD